MASRSAEHGLTTSATRLRAGRWWDGHRTAGLLLVYGALAVLLAIPILVSQVPLGVDDLNHLARIYVRAHIDSDADLARLFVVRSELIPYLGMDWLLTPLARVLPIMLVGRIYLLALVWGLVGATVVVQRVFTGRVGLAPAATGLITYNGLLAWGLINYVLGVILALLVFAAWHAGRDRPWLARLALFSVAATGLYLTHLLAFGLYGVLVVSYEILSRPRPWRTPWRDWVVLAGQAIPGLLLWIMIAGRMPMPGSGVRYSMMEKLLAIGSPFLFRGAVGGADIGRLVGCLCAVGFYLGLRRGWLAWPRSLAGPTLTLLVLTIILPSWVFGVALTDNRLMVPAVCLALAGVRLTGPSLKRALPLAAGLALLTVVRVTDVSMLMRRCDGQYAELRRALAMLPRGAVLTTVLERTEPVPGVACTDLPIYEHISQLVTLDRSGYAPDFFARVTSVGVRGGLPTDTDPKAARLFTTAPAAGYVLRIHLGRSRPVPAGLVLLRDGGFFDLWAVAKGSQVRTVGAGAPAATPAPAGGSAPSRSSRAAATSP